jgi:hypothetical protein
MTSVPKQKNLALFQDMNDALTAAIHAIGGFKDLGIALRPELGTRPQTAAQWLRDCLNPEKREKLSPEQLLHLLRVAREANYHAAKHWIDGEAGYADSEPLDPRDEMADLQRKFIEAVHMSRDISDKIERLARSPLKAVVGE